jgi:CRP/FNR family transcriptional regulator, anaerobic regulatory protein
MILGNGRSSGYYTSCERCPLRVKPSLREFTDEELAFVKDFKLDELRVDPGACFLREGTRSDYLYTVLSGWAFRYKMLDDGRRQMLNYALPADMLGLQGVDRRKSG